MQIDAIDFDIDNGAADLEIQLVDLDLAEVLALEGDDVTGTGRLAGRIPISLQHNTVLIRGGVISASEPGRIKLAPALASSITQPGLDIALKALGNFSYEKLESSIDYDDQGDMALGILLEGRNPDVEDGRPIHFNLNISENIPVLLQSLRLQDTLIRQIEKKVQ